MHRPEEMHKHMGGSTEAAKENCCSLVKNVSYQSKTWEACRAITLICCWKRNTKPVWQKTFKYTKYNFLIMIIMIILCS